MTSSESFTSPVAMHALYACARMQTVARSALVTGGSRGIGLAIARMLAEEGFALTLAARNAERVEAAAAELGALAVTADVSKDEDCETARGRARRAPRRARRPRQLGRHRHRRQRRGADHKHIDLQLGVNLRGLVLVTRAAIPHLRTSRGLVVNLASIAGTMPTPGLSIYGASKAAVISFTRSLNEELDARRRARDRALPGLRRHRHGRRGAASRARR